MLAIAAVVLTTAPAGAARISPPSPGSARPGLAAALTRNPHTIRGILRAQREAIAGRATPGSAAVRADARSASASTATVLRARAPYGANVISIHDEGELRSIDGKDGSTAWQLSRPNWQTVWNAGDLDRDGYDDLLLLQIDAIIGSGDLVIHITFNQVIEAISGATGARLWQRIEPCAADAAGPLLTHPFVVDLFVLHVQNLVTPGVLDTATASPTIFIDEFDWEYGNVDVAGVRASSISATERAVLLRADGVERARVETRTVAGGFPYTVPLADLDGDGHTDLLVWEFTVYPAGTRTGLAAFRGVSAFSGADAHRLWTANDFPDLAVSGRKGYDPTTTFPLALAGRGAETDVLVVNTAQPRVGLELRSGLTGASRWHVDLGSDVFYRRTWTPGDIDRDGIGDVLILVERASCTLGTACGAVAEIDLIAVGGAGGEELWRRAFGPREVPEAAVRAGDFDGDGIADVVIGDGSGGYSAVRSSDGATLWSIQTSVFDSIPAALGADLDRDGSEDLAWTETRPRPNGVDVETVVVLSGATGAPLWSVEEAGRFLSSLGFAADLDRTRDGVEFVQPLAVGPPDAHAFSAGGAPVWLA